MPFTRRTFLRTGATTAATVAAASVVPRPLLAHLGRVPEPIPPIQDTRLKELTQRAIDAAKRAGAVYADVRLTHLRMRIIQGDPRDIESMTVGVRALVNGYWGFATSPIWSFDEMERLSRESVHQAKTNILGRVREVDLAPLPAVAKGHWEMPVEIDPFSIHPDEISDYLRSLMTFTVARIQEIKFSAEQITAASVSTIRETAFASTDGSFCTQRQYLSAGDFNFSVRNPVNAQKDAHNLELLLPAAMGWELFKRQPLREEIEQRIAETVEYTNLPQAPVDVGRYNIAIDASSMSRVLSSTIGAATELDRALGYEANASGTSYLNDPAEMLGTYKIGNPILNVTANRTEPKGAATVRWDDEGVTPTDYTIVNGGVLSEFSATREGAGWLNDYYSKTNTPRTPKGCAHGGRDILGGTYAPVVCTPNLAITPGNSPRSFDDCIREIGNGIAFRRMQFNMDFQQLNGLATGKAYEIKNGKKIAAIGGLGLLFRAPEFWRSLSGLGDAGSAQRFGITTSKGEPPQMAFHSVTAVPAMFKDVTIVDVMRKA